MQSIEQLSAILLDPTAVNEACAKIYDLFVSAATVDAQDEIPFELPRRSRSAVKRPGARSGWLWSPPSAV